ncbi:MAG: hypothetical protein AABX29_06805 [Nanoarchaeota archaeon]
MLRNKIEYYAIRFSEEDKVVGFEALGNISANKTKTYIGLCGGIDVVDEETLRILDKSGLHYETYHLESGFGTDEIFKHFGINPDYERKEKMKELRQEALEYSRDKTETILNRLKFYIISKIFR